MRVRESEESEESGTRNTERWESTRCKDWASELSFSSKDSRQKALCWSPLKPFSLANLRVE